MKTINKILFREMTAMELAKRISEVENGGKYHIVDIDTNKKGVYNQETKDVDVVVSFDLEIAEND